LTLKWVGWVGPAGYPSQIKNGAAKAAPVNSRNTAKLNAKIFIVTSPVKSEPDFNKTLSLCPVVSQEDPSLVAMSFDAEIASHHM
jgi:hypothetical protein